MKFAFAFRQSLTVTQRGQTDFQLVYGITQAADFFICFITEPLERFGGCERHHPAQIRMVSSCRHGEMCRKFGIFVQTGHSPADQNFVIAVIHHRAVFNADIRQGVFIDGHDAQREIRRIFGHQEADVHRHSALRIFDILGGCLLAVQHKGNLRQNVRTLIRCALINDAASVRLPGQRFTVQRKYFVTADIFNR